MYTKIEVCNLGHIAIDLQHFWIGTFENFQNTFDNLKVPHKNDFYTLLFINNAFGVIQIDNDLVKLENTKIVIIEPGCVNTINIEDNASGKVICFTETFFSLRYNNNILNQFSFLKKLNPVISCVSLSQFDKIENLLQLIHCEYLLTNKDKMNVLRSYINIILFELQRLDTTENQESKTNIRLEKINQFKNLIQQFYSEQKLPSYYADKLNITANHLNKLCKEATGKTAGDLIRYQIKIEAQRKLRFTSLSINEIADELGFDNPSYFITFFKKQAGITPEQFRKKN